MNTPKKASAAQNVVATLNRQQANALVLYLNYKKCHWLTFGPLFRDIHLMFDEHGSQVLAMIDEFAERALTIDGAPVADPKAYIESSSVRASQGNLTLQEMISEAVQNLNLVIHELHADTAIASAAGDIGTADLYTRLVQEYQKQRWFLKELLRKGDGLVT